MGEIVYTSKARIEPVRGPIRHAYLGDVPEPVVYGMQGSLRDWYKAPPAEPDTASTLDHIVGAVGGWMLGTLRGALAARGIRTNKDTLGAQVEGLIEKVGAGIKITTIRIHYTLTVPAGKRAEAERAVAVHDKGCPAAQSVTPAITVEWDAEYTEV